MSFWFIFLVKIFYQNSALGSSMFTADGDFDLEDQDQIKHVNLRIIIKFISG